jgi:hypothetical protein
MRAVTFAAVLAAALTAAATRPAAAEDGVPVIEPDPTPAPAAPAPRVSPPGATDAARLRALQEQVVQREALRIEGRRITRGGVPISAGALYAAVGRPDLTQRIRTRRIAKGITIGAGIGLAAFGTVWGIADSAGTAVNNGIGRAVNLCGSEEMSPECADRHEASMVPWALAIGGGLAALIGAAVPSDPLDSLEKSALIDEHNQRLRAGLGLSGAFETAWRTATVRAAARPDGQSGMVLAGCSF